MLKNSVYVVLVLPDIYTEGNFRQNYAQKPRVLHKQNSVVRELSPNHFYELLPHSFTRDKFDGRRIALYCLKCRAFNSKIKLRGKSYSAQHSKRVFVKSLLGYTY